MAQITITEALAETKTLKARITKAGDTVLAHAFRPSMLKDPFAQAGGTPKYLGEVFQSIAALEQRVVGIRTRINMANATNRVVIGSMDMTVAEWLVWRREVMPAQTSRLGAIVQSLDTMRREAQRKGADVVAKEDGGTDKSILVSIDEKRLRDEISMLTQIDGELDGKLSLFNATVTIDV